MPVAIRHLPQEQQTQIMAVLRMPQSQVDMLPAEQKAQIMQLVSQALGFSLYGCLDRGRRTIADCVRIAYLQRTTIGAIV